MNIESVNLLSLLPGTSNIEGGTQSLLENGAISEGFANALMGQIEFLSEATATGQVELPVQMQSMTIPKTLDNLHGIGDLLKHKGNREELAALFDNSLSMLYKKNEDIDLEATLLALTDSLKTITPSITPDEIAIAQNMNLALSDALKAITSGSTSDNEEAAAQDMSAVMALNGLSFTKPLPEEAKLNILGEENVASGDFLQKETVLRQSIQNEQGVNLQSLENTDSVEKTLVFEKQASISGIEKAVPGVTADMVHFHKPIDNRTDSPVITKPLTHPDWSRDLGEQIVWMNNKAIPAAEIKLNPAHLGPISVRIDVNQDQATIMFTAQHTEVKEAIEASIPKLREMLSTQQLNLINVNISHNAMSDQGRSHSQPFAKTPENREQGTEDVTDVIEKTEPDRVIVSKGLLSLYV